MSETKDNTCKDYNSEAGDFSCANSNRDGTKCAFNGNIEKCRAVWETMKKFKAEVCPTCPKRATEGCVQGDDILDMNAEGCIIKMMNANIPEMIAEILDHLEPNDIIDYFGYGNLLDNVPDEMLISVLQKRGYTVEDKQYETRLAPTREEFQKSLPEGWTIEVYPEPGSPDACEWYYKQTDEIFVQIRKGDHVLQSSPGGDIRIYGKAEGDYFSYRNSHESGRLTEKLIHEGNWENNNWLDVEYWNIKQRNEAAAKLPPGEMFPDFHECGGLTFEDVRFGVSEVTEFLAECAGKVEKGEKPF